jgi:hypothetical protein
MYRWILPFLRLFSLKTAFAAGYALAKALFEFGRARWGFKASEVRPEAVLSRFL